MKNILFCAVQQVLGYIYYMCYDYVHLDNLSDISALKCCETTTYTVTFTDFYHEQ